MNKTICVTVYILILLNGCFSEKSQIHKKENIELNNSSESIEFDRFDYIAKELEENCHSDFIKILKYNSYLKIYFDGYKSFKPRSFDLTDIAKSEIKCISQFIKYDDDLVVQAVGYANDSISLKYNRYLANSRAIVVAEEFADSGRKENVYAIGCAITKVTLNKIDIKSDFIYRNVDLYIYEDISNIKDPCK